jgi:RsiW-degrading membrane proteinase PrsW (M82 family)
VDGGRRRPYHGRSMPPPSAFGALILYATLALSAVAAGALVYHYDLYDREPAPLLALAVVLGAGAMAVAGRGEAFVLAPALITSPSGIAAVAALQEELAKLAVVLAIARLAPRQFNDPMDGLIYGSMAGLGMAIEESAYFLRHPPFQGSVLPPTELVRICGHVVMGGIGGFPLGMARMGMKRWPSALILCTGAAVGMHFAWDWDVLASVEGASSWRTGGLVVVVSSGLLLYGALVELGSGWSRQVFAPASPERLWGWPFKR